MDNLQTCILCIYLNQSFSWPCVCPVSSLKMSTILEDGLEDIESSSQESSSSEESEGSLKNFIEKDGEEEDSDDSYASSEMEDSASESDSGDDDSDSDSDESMASAQGGEDGDRRDPAADPPGAEAGDFAASSSASSSAAVDEDVAELIEEAQKIMASGVTVRQRRPVEDLYVSKNVKHITKVLVKDRKKDLLAELADWQKAGMADGTDLVWPSALSKRTPFAEVQSEYDRVRRALGLDVSDDEEEQAAVGEEESEDDDEDFMPAKKRTKA